jgi:Ca2+/Na+ antiporter
MWLHITKNKNLSTSLCVYILFSSQIKFTSVLIFYIYNLYLYYLKRKSGSVNDQYVNRFVNPSSHNTDRTVWHMGPLIVVRC